jgi:glycosyltransferase involved in cell wall biosynthesis
MTRLPATSTTGVGILAIVNESPRDWADAVRTLEQLALEAEATLRVCATDSVTMQRVLEGSPTVLAPQWNLSAAAAMLLVEWPTIDALLIVTSPVAVPANLLERALEWMRADPRIATVSFLSNAAGYLSFPYRNSPSSMSIAGHDEATVTRLLRSLEPDSGPVPIAMPSGSAILVNRGVLSTLSGFDPALDAMPRESLAHFALRAARRGFQHRLDASSYLMAQWFEGFPCLDAVDDPGARHRLHEYDSSFPALYDQQREALTAPLSIAMDVARSKVAGLRLLIDGSCLGPMEMGTQVQTLELVRALARRPDIWSIALAVPHGRLPAYAIDLHGDAKVRIVDSHNLEFTGAEMVDILHRPFQPDRPIPWERWRALAKRVVVTLQDLIAYRIGAYHPTGEAWLAYRHNIADACAKADAVVAISDDTHASIAEECFNISREQIHTAKNGSNHLDESALDEAPQELVEKGMIAVSFLLVLGATYAHKNRDLAIRVWQELRRRGHNVALVMAGANVPKGSSRVEEAVARRGGDDMLVTMPDVSSGVRTWLLRHAAVVLYPTSAEGFGLVPFEAAAMGTPTAHVNFGPLRELIDNPDVPRQWSVDALADFTQRLLTDPSAARENIGGILRSGNVLTWDDTAASLVDAYRKSLARAART